MGVHFKWELHTWYTGGMMLAQINSKELTQNGVAIPSSARIWAITLIMGGSITGSILLRDGGVSGTKRWKLSGAAGTCVFISFPAGLSFETSVYAALDNATAYIAYE
jgi:hypothetical protein